MELQTIESWRFVKAKRRRSPKPEMATAMRWRMALREFLSHFVPIERVMMANKQKPAKRPKPTKRVPGY